MIDKIKYKYSEDKILSDMKSYIDKTYTQHYKTGDNSIECFDAWIALGDATPTFRNTALKYLWRLGKKGNEQDEINDVIKAIHYCFMILHTLKYKNK